MRPQIAPIAMMFAMMLFTGTWAVRGTIGNPIRGESSPVCALHQSGAAISGRCTGPNGTGPVDGVASGRSITFHWHITPTTPVGLGGVATYSGTLVEDGVIRGTWMHSALPGLSGPFTAQLVKK